MIAEENLSDSPGVPQISIAGTSIIFLIDKLMKQTIPSFKSYIASGFYKKRNLSEDDFTQIYIEQAQILIRRHDYPFNVGGQYRDISNLSSGFSDFYFFPNEQNVSTASFFSVESKRLPSPVKSREKEYVIGNKKNGGIERYKIEKHGKGLNECGMLGFIEGENFEHWNEKINNWIKELAKSDKNWSNDEVLSIMESQTDFCSFKSIAYRKSDAINLTHLWVILA